MPWTFPWTEFLKKRACRYLLQHYLGQFLKEKLTLDQLSVDLYNGKGTIKGLELDVESLNDALNNLNVPVEIVDGFINKISVSIPWTTLIQSSTEMDIQGLELTLQPKQRNQNASGLESMFNSMSSMNTSLQIAEDCLKSVKSDGDQAGDIGQPYEGVQKFAQTIDSVLCRVKVSLTDTVIRLEHLPMSSEKGVAMEIRIKRIEYYDDLAKEQGSPVDDVEKVRVWEPAAIAHKNITLEGVQIFADEFSRNSRHSDSDSSLSSPKTFVSTSSSPPLSPDNQSEEPTNQSFSMSEPIQIAVLTGRTNLKLKIKQGDSIQGPKLETDFELGGLHVLLSPKHFHCILELFEGLSSPATNDGRKRQSRTSKNKPMCSDDYQKVEKELQRQLQCGRVQQQQRFAQTQYFGMQDILTHSIGDEEEEQYFSLGPDRIRDMESSVNSNYSINSNRSTSTVSTVRQGQRKDNRAGKDSLQRILDDPTAELCRYHIRLTFFSFCLLHENPNQRVELSCNSKLEKPSKMRDIANSYFQKVFSFSAAGLSELKEIREKFTDALHFDHLRFVGKPLKIECTEKTVPTHQSLTVELSVGLFEALECLFNRGTDQSKPEYAELLVFRRDVSDNPTQMYSSVYAGEPSIKATIKNVEQIRGPLKAKSCPKTEISITLGQLESEIDVTLVDRINSLVKPEPLHRTYTGSNGQQSGAMQYTLAETLEEGSMSSERKTDISVTSASAKVIFRFPIPDLRPASEVGKLPWWQKNLRDEILVLQLEEARFQTSYMSSQVLEELDFSCKEALGSFRIDPNQSPVPFAYISCEGDNDDGFNFPQLIIKFSERTMSELEETPSLLDNSPTFDSLNGACDFTKRTPSPFSSKKHMYGKEEMSEKDHISTHVSKELIMPGDREEVSEFQEKSTSNSKMIIELKLPYVNLFLPDKHFYEVLYNRINNDLLLWEPMAPFPLQTQDLASASIQPFDLSCYPHVLQDHFSMAKSALCESSDEDEDMSFGYYSIHDSRYPKQKQQGKQLPNKMCLSLKIDKGKITAHTKSQVEHTHGEVIAIIEDGNLFVVSHYQGDPCLQYICFLCNKAELYHSGAVQNKKEDIDLQNFEVPLALRKQRTIYQSEPGVHCHYMSDNGYDLDSVDMVSVAVKVKLDSTPISDLTRDEKIKEFLVAVGVRDATLQHRMAESKQNWISQVMDFLDVKDYDLLGYTMPKVLTELHVHLWNCSVDYRPLHIPTKAVLAAKSFSISSNIVADSPTSLLRFVLDDAGLYLSQSSSSLFVDLKKDYVCVIDLERFELEFRSSDGKDQRFPITDLRVLTNRVNIRTCSDSCAALTELIQYFANDGDLLECDERVQPKEEDILPDTMSKNSSENEDELEGTGLSVSCQEHLNTMVEDAMQESSSASGNELDSTDSPGKPPMEVFFVPDSDENSQSVPPAGVMRPIVISASADSVTSSAISDQPEALSDDEEFCIIDDPGLGITPKDGEPEVKVYTDEPIEIKENYFTQPLGRTDLLKAPDHFPNPEYRYTLKELTAVWYMYGGSDFGNKPVHLDHDREVTVTKRTSDMGDYMSDLSIKYTAKGTGASPDKIHWQVRGGRGRDLSTLMELQLSKVRMQYDIYPSHTEQSCRQVLVIHDVEIRDRLVNSSINKFLYQYSSENMPKQTHANMVLIKALHTRPDPADRTEECALKVSLQPLRLNIDQDSLFFLKKFLTDLGISKHDTQKMSAENDTEVKQRPSSASKAATTVHPPPVMTVGQKDSPLSENDSQEMLMMFDDMQKSSDKGQITHDQPSEPIAHSTDDLELENKVLPVFIKSFVFSPDVPIRLDYHGKKWVGEHGTLAGLLVGLAHLNCSELKLKKLNYRHGFLGLEKLQAHCIHEWINDIIKNQLPSILGGVGPMHSFVQLGQGIRDLFWLPVEQYKRDGRLVRGIQRGATSFSTSTAMAVLELTNRMVQSVQYVAEVTYDMVNPGPSVLMQRHRLRGPPSDVREGVENAYIAIKEGFSTTAQNIVDVASKEHEQKGVTGAVGAAIRLVPPTVISPFIIATEATSNVLGGMRNQLQPDAKKEEEEKWKPKQT